jgi:hypothetical protein
MREKTCLTDPEVLSFMRRQLLLIFSSKKLRGSNVIRRPSENSDNLHDFRIRKLVDVLNVQSLEWMFMALRVDAIEIANLKRQLPKLSSSSNTRFIESDCGLNLYDDPFRWPRRCQPPKIRGNKYSAARFQSFSDKTSKGAHEKRFISEMKINGWSTHGVVGIVSPGKNDSG